MSLSDSLITADTRWITVATDPQLLDLEMEHWQRHKALLEGDLAANDGDPEITAAGIDYCDAVLDELLKQAYRIARAKLDPIGTITSAEQIRARMARANALDTFEVLDRLTGVWSRLGPRDEHWMCCPLEGHDEKTPSFHMNDDGRWYCFGCQRGGGDKVSFAAAFMQSSQMAGLLLLEEIFSLGAKAFGL